MLVCPTVHKFDNYWLERICTRVALCLCCHVPFPWAFLRSIHLYTVKRLGLLLLKRFLYCCLHKFIEEGIGSLLLQQNVPISHGSKPNTNFRLFHPNVPRLAHVICQLEGTRQRPTVYLHNWIKENTLFTYSVTAGYISNPPPDKLTSNIKWTLYLLQYKLPATGIITVLKATLHI